MKMKSNRRTAVEIYQIQKKKGAFFKITIKLSNILATSVRNLLQKIFLKNPNLVTMPNTQPLKIKIPKSNDEDFCLTELTV